MTPARPSVTIAVFSYNTGRYVASLLRSLQAQTWERFEVVIFEDGSTDNSIEIIQPFLADKRFQLIASKQNRGLGHGVASAMENIRGDYCVLIAADDELKPDFLARRIALMEEDPEVALAHGGVELIDESGAALPADSALAGHATKMQEIDARLRRWPAIMDPADALALLLQHNVICAPSIFTRASITRAWAARIPMKWNWASDWFLSLLHAASGKMAYDPAPLARYRVHGNSMSHHARYNGPKQAEIRLAPLCALSLAAGHSAAAAGLWAKYRKPLYALWLRRALVLHRAKQLDEGWLRMAAAAYYGEAKIISLPAEIMRHAVNITWTSGREAAARKKQWLPVAGLAQIQHPFFS